ncbi:MAG: molybdate ABC transporter permease subunit [Armatimonadetes bacterium]|nr:molybdate ABC transporter permease subunit [Armatimonadota bacterium]
MPGRNRAILLLLSAPALGLIVLPLVGLFLNTELARFGSYVCCPQVAEALRLTLATSLISAVLILLIGTPMAYWLAYTDFRGKQLVDTLVDLPLVLPPAVAGVALLMTFGRVGFIGIHLAPKITLPFTTAAVIIAQTFVAGPFYVRQARVGFESVPRQLQMASLTMGASPLRTFLKVTVPIASHAILAGLVMAWARAVGEFGATLMFAGNLQGVTQTMPLAIYAAMEQDIRIPVVLSVTLVAVSFLVIIITKFLLSPRSTPQEAVAPSGRA